MNQLSLNLVAIGIFTITMTSLLGPMISVSPLVPAIAAAGILGLATLDTLSWRGQGSTLMLDWLAGFSSGHRNRVIRHEAGHFLVAHQLNIPATGYTLNAWDALKHGYPGQGGVRFDSEELEAAIQQGQLSGQLLDRYCTIWMAGIAAEMLIYGNVEGGADDRQKLRGLLAQLGLPPAELEQKERWSLLRAKTLLQDNVSAYEALMIAMTQGASVAECGDAIDQHLPQTV
ncbi:ATP-dependent Zn protease [Stenomitos frigidus]|uniref:ATP-dependent Zn protease n=1 Tax=Stenomitos frigidus ULC18 TaxID=2107698 RepID=A0A2T1DTT0_9CYAN|nr:ATP-dependent Zn protease [Stenomitos frigidus]PSB23885.1 ATP-dependent Zn protease [Stenomitos frigidus ULC18]